MLVAAVIATDAKGIGPLPLLPLPFSDASANLFVLQTFRSTICPALFISM